MNIAEPISSLQENIRAGIQGLAKELQETFKEMRALVRPIGLAGEFKGKIMATATPGNTEVETDAKAKKRARRSGQKKSAKVTTAPETDPQQKKSRQNPADKEAQAKLSSPTAQAAGNSGEQTSSAQGSPETTGSGKKPVKEKQGGILKELGKQGVPPSKLAAGATGAVRLAGAAVEKVLSLGKVSDELDLSITRWQAWVAAAEDAGGTAEGMATSFRELSKGIGQAVYIDDGPLKKIAAEQDIELKDAEGKARATEAVMLDLAAAFQKMDPQASAAFGRELGLDPGAIQLLQQGRSALEALLQARQANAAFNQSDVETARELSKSLDTLKESWDRLVLDFVQQALPLLTGALAKLNSLIGFVSEHSEAFLGALIGLAIALALAMAPVLIAFVKAHALFLACSAVFSAIGFVIGDVIAWIKRGKSAFLDFFNSLSEGWRKTKEKLFSALPSGIKKFFGIEEKVMVAEEASSPKLPASRGSLDTGTWSYEDISVARNVPSFSDLDKTIQIAASSPAGNITNTTNNNRTSTTNIGTIEIHTPATDARGLAADLKPALEAALADGALGA